VTELDKLWDHPAPHTLRTRVGAGDIDGLDHTNNAVYVKWCEQVAWSHSVALGLDLERYRALDRAMAITHSEYNYLQASREGDEIIRHLDRGLGPQTHHGPPLPGYPPRRRRHPAARCHALCLYRDLQWQAETVAKGVY
jgi:hypothetical protein